VDPDQAEALKWFRLAEQGLPEAQCLLGLAYCRLGQAYYHGAGVGQDRAEALKWFRLAAEQENYEALRLLREFS
jgi:TPR repeat protein